MTNYTTLRRNLMSALLIPAIGLSAASALGAGEGAQKGAQQAAQTSQGKQSKAQAQDNARYMRASEVIGRNVRGAKGNDLGEINDLIVDVKTQRVRYAILGFGGILGMGEKLFAYPIQAFKESPNRESLVLNVPEERLEQSPGFERDRWPDWGVDDYAERVERFYGDVTGTRQTERMQAREQQLVRASEMLGRDIVDRTGDDLGEITDLVVNMQNGEIRVAVLDFERNWGSDELLLPMSLKAFHFPATGGDPVLNVSPDEVDSRLGFTEDAWPDFSDPAYGREPGRTGKPSS